MQPNVIAYMLLFRNACCQGSHYGIVRQQNPAGLQMFFTGHACPHGGHGAAGAGVEERVNALTPSRLHRVCLWVRRAPREGTVLRELAALPLAEDIPIAHNSCRRGPRAVGWRDDCPGRDRLDRGAGAPSSI